MRRLGWMLVLVGCQVPGNGGEGGLMVVSDTAQMGPPPACNDAPPTTGMVETGETSGGTGGTSGEESGAEGVAGVAAMLSQGTGGSRAGDPGTAFCAGFKSSATCDGTPRMDGDTLVGECRWVSVVPVVPGTCEATVLYSTCVHVPHDGRDCEFAQSCGQIGLGVYGRMGCDGNVEVIVVPPGQAFCKAPTDWPLCWPDDTAPECSCICS